MESEEKQKTEAYAKGLNEELKIYKRLEKINQSEEFNDFFNLQLDTVVKKMLSCFTGTGPKDWDEFCRIRGEVIGVLYPIQQVRGAKQIQAQVKEQLDIFYNQPI